MTEAQLATLGRRRWRAPADLLCALPPPAAAPPPDSPAGRLQQRARRLRRVVTPACACAMTLTELTGLDTDALLTLDLLNVDRTACRLNLHTRRVTIPAELRALVRAQLICRAAARIPASPDAPLFVHGLGRRATAPLLNEWIRQATSRGPIRREAPWLDGPRVYGRMLLIRGEPRRVPPADIGQADRNRY